MKVHVPFDYARSIRAAARVVALGVQIERAKLECQQLIARYRALGCEAAETPGLAAALGRIRQLANVRAITALEIASA